MGVRLQQAEWEVGLGGLHGGVLQEGKGERQSNISFAEVPPREMTLAIIHAPCEVASASKGSCSNPVSSRKAGMRPFEG